MNKYKTWDKLKEPAPDVDQDGNKFWRNSKGELHREDGLAIMWADGSKFWYLNGIRHREDGPAIIWSDGGQWWFLYGNQLTEEEFNEQIQKARLK